MVVDIQGVIGKNEHILTDPVVHSLSNNKEYGMGDLGNLGMKAFNVAHRCSVHCQSFGFFSLGSLVGERDDTILKTESNRDDPLCFLCWKELFTKEVLTHSPCGHSLHKDCLETIKMKKIYKDRCGLCFQKVEKDSIAIGEVLHG